MATTQNLLQILDWRQYFGARRSTSSGAGALPHRPTSPPSARRCTRPRWTRAWTESTSRCVPESQNPTQHPHHLRGAAQGGAGPARGRNLLQGASQSPKTLPNIPTICEALHKAALDPRVDGIYFKVGPGTLNSPLLLWMGPSSVVPSWMLVVCAISASQRPSVCSECHQHILWSGHQQYPLWSEHHQHLVSR